MMENDNKYIDQIIRESLSERPGDPMPPDLSEKIIRRISRDRLFRSIFFDFSIKSITVFLIFAISIAVFLTIGNQADYWLNVLKNNILIIIGVLGMVYFIFFLTEITEKYLSEKKVY